MKTKKILSLLVIFIVAILMLTVALGSVQAVNAAPKKVKVTWNGNGGKIGTAKTTTTTVTKGAKIGKLPKTPKKAGYGFKGWYTKKTGGTKITKVTKVKKKITYYAQWKKGSSVSNTGSNKALNEDEKKLIGSWFGTDSSYTFKADGSFVMYAQLPLTPKYHFRWSGSYSLKNGVLSLSYQESSSVNYGETWTSWSKVESDSYKLTFGKDATGQYFEYDEHGRFYNK